MFASTTIAVGLRGRVRRLLAVGAVALALGTGLGVGLAPERADARYVEQIDEPVECNPMGYQIVPGVVVDCNRVNRGS